MGGSSPTHPKWGKWRRVIARPRVKGRRSGFTGAVVALDDVVQRLPGREPYDLLTDQSDGPAARGRGVAADVRRDEDPRRRPERMPGGQRLGIGHVEPRAQAPGRELGQ